MPNKKQNKKRSDELKKGIYRILDVPNICYPLMQKGMKFKVAHTCFAKIPKNLLNKYNRFRLNINPASMFNIIYLRDLNTILWKTIKSNKLDKTYAGCWLVPLDIKELPYLSENERVVEITFDVLIPEIKWSEVESQ